MIRQVFKYVVLHLQDGVEWIDVESIESMFNYFSESLLHECFLKYYYINNYTEKNHENKHLLKVWEFLQAFRNCKLRTFSGNDGLISWTNFSTTHSVNTIGIAVAEKKFSISSIPTTEDIFFFSTSNSFLFNFVETNVFFFSRNIRWYLLASLPNNEW